MPHVLKKSKEEVLEMHSWYCCGLSLRKVADKFGLDRKMVHYYFKRDGLETRPPFSLKEDRQEWGGKIFTYRNDRHGFRMTTGTRELMARYVWRTIHGYPELPSDVAAIHKDGNIRNNHPGNLELVPKSQSGKYARHNNAITKGQPRRVVNKFCLNCGVKISGRGKSPSYIKERKFCSPKCLGVYRKGTKRGANVEAMKKQKASKLLFGSAVSERLQEMEFNGT